MLILCGSRKKAFDNTCLGPVPNTNTSDVTFNVEFTLNIFI